MCARSHPDERGWVRAMIETAPARVLLVDDRPENLLALETLLTPVGYHLTRAESGREALRHVLQNDFAVILLDVQMPEMDGFETARLIRARERSRHTPIVFLTAHSTSDSEVARAYATGAVDYLLKPLVPEILRAKVAAFVEMRRMMDALRDEVLQRRQAEEEVRELTRSLERRVAERTAQLAAAKAEVEENLRRLRESEGMRDDLTSMIVHDLRIPLTSVLAGLETVEAMGPLSDVQRECLSMAMDGGRTLLDMVNDLLDISKMEDGSLGLEREDLAPAEVVDAAVKQVASLLDGKQLTLKRDLASKLPHVLADGDKLRRTLVNLLGNAIRFTPAGRRITVSVHRRLQDPALLFAVRDSGEGIPRHAFDRIFEKFGQVETRRSDRARSTGLGLTFCKLAVEAHGGQIWVESELGKGSTFYFTIPLLALRLEPPAVEIPPEVGPGDEDDPAGLACVPELALREAA